MTRHTPEYFLPSKTEAYLGTLSKLYAHEGLPHLQKILVNSQASVHEAWTSDRWNGGTYGHAVTLVLPETLFFSIVGDKDAIRQTICSDLNNLHNFQNESFAEIFLEAQVEEGQDWREDSGLRITANRLVSPDAAKRIWNESEYRVFLSHKTEVKKETALLKRDLGVFGISCFVAHEDIHPTKAWQEEIENALATMDAFVAILTTDFHDSNWTDQEVGYAVARGVPIVALKFGKDPYGFIGKFQALSADWKTASSALVKLLINHNTMFDAFVHALANCHSWDTGNVLAKALPGIERLSDAQVDQLVNAFNTNGELRGSFGFTGTWRTNHGPGLVHFLNLFGNRQFEYGADRENIVPLKAQPA